MSGTDHNECAVCGGEPDPDRIPPKYVYSLASKDRTPTHVEAYPFGSGLSVPFACSDECFSQAQEGGFTRYVGTGTEKWACDECGERKSTCTKGGASLCNECAFSTGIEHGGSHE